MLLRSRGLFQTVRTEGGLLPADLLLKVAEGDRDLPGLDASSYHLGPNERLNERITGAWNRLQGSWSAFRSERAKLVEGDSGARITRELWQHPLFDQLGYGRLIQQRAVEIGGKPYPVFSQWQNTPIHFVGCNTPLDQRTPGVQGAATQSPHSIVQELLNRSNERLWGVLTNGLRLRILRDNLSLTRQAFVEFDLEAMLEGEAYADFSLLWLVCHQSRVEGEAQDDCWLERWSAEATETGTRALDQLRYGVEEALAALGSGFLSHPHNEPLRASLRAGELDPAIYYRQVLRIVYRLLFLFVTEDRNALLDPNAGEEARTRYSEHYSTSRLRRLSARRRGSRHHDAYEQLKLVMGALHEDGSPPIAVPPLGGLLWSPEAVGHLAQARLANHALFEAIRDLAFVEDGGILRPVDFRNLGAQELGSVYESLLDLQPEIDVSSGAFSLIVAPGSERQDTGAYYTPDSLIALLLDATLDPILERAMASDDPEAALFALRVCDPACGSGHFLIAAAHRIARRVATIRTGDTEAAPEALREALRDVIARCVYGVDVNPMSVELCKVSLWLDAVVPGRPLSFLDGHVRVGNSLVGTTLDLLDEGVPRSAYKRLAGDDPAVLDSLRRENATESAGQLTMADEVHGLGAVLAEQARQREAAGRDETLADVHAREEQQRTLEQSAASRRLRAAADAWVAAFLGARHADAVRFTTGTSRRLASGEDQVAADAAEAVAVSHRIFHWELEFPAIFAEGAGFDAVVGNPPWGRVKLQDKRFFAVPAPEIAAAPNKAARDRMVADLADSDPDLLARYQAELRRFEALSLFVHDSGRYPLTGVGDVNTYALFAELARSLLGDGGRAGMVLQGGIVTDDTTKAFFSALVDSRSLVSVYGFENEGSKPLFPAITNKVKFCVLSFASPGAGPEEFGLSFFNHQPSTARDPARLFRLTAEDIAAINPNTRTCPVFRSSRDAEIMRLLHRRFPILITEGPPERNPWGVTFQSMFHMANDSGFFRTAEQLEVDGWERENEIFVRGDERCLPLLEGKMTWLWNPRFGTYEGQTQAQRNKGVLPPSPEARLADPSYVNRPLYWVEGGRVEKAWKGSHDWALAWRDVGPSERTFVVSVVPRWAAGHTLPLMHVADAHASSVLCLVSALSSLVTDYAARARSATGRMVFFVVRHLPTPEPSEFQSQAPWDTDVSLGNWFTQRALRLIFTAQILEPLARDAGYGGSPFGWTPDDRRGTHAELDAGMFHLSGLERDHVEHVLDSFRVLRENEQKQHDEFLTRRLVLERYDALEAAKRTASVGAA